MKLKSTLLSILLLACVSANAEGIAYQFNGNTLKDGDTVVVNAAADDFGAISASTNDATNKLVLANLTANATVSASLDILDNPTGATFMWCMGTDCTAPTKAHTEKTGIKATGTTLNTQFDAVFTSYGSVLVLITSTVNFKKYKVYVKALYNDPAGINETSTGKTVKSTEYFDLSGRSVVNPLRGVYVKSVTYTDGTKGVSKVLK